MSEFDNKVTSDAAQEGDAVEAFDDFEVNASEIDGSEEGFDVDFATAEQAVVDAIEAAENVAEQWGITREMQDEFALRSQQNTAKAQEEGKFDEEIIPVMVKVKKLCSIVSDSRVAAPGLYATFAVRVMTFSCVVTDAFTVKLSPSAAPARDRE